MATDQPTPPDLGNLTNAQFLALADWSVIATNIPGKDDTFESMQDCVVALIYRVIRDNFAYENLAWGCLVDTPISLKIAALELAATAQRTETDFPAIPLTSAAMVGVIPQPDLIWTCHGTRQEDSGGTILEPPSPGEDIVYPVVSAQGSLGSGPAFPFVFGIRTHAERAIHAGDTSVVRQQDIAYQASYSLPEWPQDTVQPIVLAKVADKDTPVDVGINNRIGFEFGLGRNTPGDVNANERDYCLYVRWYDAGDVEQRIVAKLASPAFPEVQPIGITPGRRITLGFHRHFDAGMGNWGVRFYVNGREVSGIQEVASAPSIATASDVRLHIGSAQLGMSYTGGPVNNVMVWANGDPAGVAAAMLTAYLRGEGFQAVP